MTDSRPESWSDDDLSPILSPDANKKSNRPLSKRTYLVQELVTSQQQFLMDMKSVYEAMKAENKLLNDVDGQQLFVYLHDIVEVAEQLCNDWNNELSKHAKHNAEDAMVAFAMEQYTGKLDETFFRYATKYDAAMFQGNDSMQTFLNAVVKRMKEDKPLLTNLETELIKPVQRMIKFSQLFESLQNHTAENHPDYTHTCRMFEFFHQLLRRANEDKRWNEIVSETFRCQSKRKNSKRFLQKLFFGEKLPSDPKLAQEKRKLDALQFATTSFMDWVEEQMDIYSDCFRFEQKFMESLLDYSDLNGNISLNERVGWNPSPFPISRSSLQSHISIADSTLSNLNFVIIPKLKKNVLARLKELIPRLQDPELLIDQLNKTEKELTLSKDQLRQTQMRGQSTTALAEKCTDLEHTVKTLRRNLLDELPVLLKVAEKLLLQLTSYTFLLFSTLANGHAEKTKHQLDEDKRKSQGNVQMNTEDYTQFINEIHRKMIPEKFRRHTITNPIALKKISKKLSSHSTRRPSDLFDTSRLRSRLRSPSFNRLILTSQNRGKSPVPQRSNSERPMLTQAVGGNQSVPDLSQVSINAIGFGLLMPSEPPPFKATKNKLKVQKVASHRALYNYKADNPHGVSIQQGDLVILLADRDETGNKQWCKVSVLPSKKVGYVPTNYLRPI